MQTKTLHDLLSNILFVVGYVVIISVLLFQFPASSFAQDSESLNNLKLEDKWNFNSSSRLLINNFSGSPDRENLTTFGLFVSGNYSDQGELSFGFNRKKLLFNANDTHIAENSLFFSGRVNYLPNYLPGQFTLRFDSYYSEDKNLFNNQIQVFNPQLSFLNTAQTFYVDLGYAQSRYLPDSDNINALQINQWTSTLGVGINQGLDWIQIKGYFIEPSETDQFQDQDNTSALEIRWTKHFAPGQFLGLDNFQLGLLEGNRLFAVDSNAHVLYSLSDLQTGGYFLGGQWSINRQLKIRLMGGIEKYTSFAVDEDYKNSYLYFNVSQDW